MKKYLFLFPALLLALTLCFAAVSANDYGNCWNNCCNPCWNGSNCCPPAPAPRNCVLFEADVTYVDGTYVAPGTSFVKTWRIRNNGTITWNTNYKLVFVSGDKMSAAASVALPYTVAPGQCVEISVPMVAPNYAGTFKGNWMLQDDKGQKFGIGGGCNQSFWVQITTVEPAPVWYCPQGCWQPRPPRPHSQQDHPHGHFGSNSGQGNFPPNFNDESNRIPHHDPNARR